MEVVTQVALWSVLYAIMGAILIYVTNKRFIDLEKHVIQKTKEVYPDLTNQEEKLAICGFAITGVILWPLFILAAIMIVKNNK